MKDYSQLTAHERILLLGSLTAEKLASDGGMIKQLVADLSDMSHAEL